jgi:hypothetical protein
MTDASGEPPCDTFSADLAELAFGILTGRERAATLAHVERCPRCADELEHLSRTADGILLAAPEIEPPVGFESRLFERMGVAEVRPSRWRAGPTRVVLAIAAAVAALGIGLGVGFASGDHSHATTQASSTPVASANLIERGHKVGHVIIYGGARPWMLMSLNDAAAQGRVTCEVVTADGRTHTVGFFTAAHGYGAWGAPLHVSPSEVRTAEVVSASGAVIATAPLH